MTEQVKMTFAWWNTGLSPAGTPKQDADLSSLHYVITELISNLDADFIALGEVSSRDTQSLRQLLKGTKYAIREFFEKTGKSRFSLAYIYKIDKFQIVHSQALLEQRATRTYRVGHFLVLKSLNLDVSLSIVTSHWPSKLHRDSPITSYLGHSLRKHLEQISDNFCSEDHIILMGDYNDEPFDDSMSSALLASRDFELVREKPSLFYNPYWISMGDHSDGKLPGSYYYKQGELSRWYSFDQMIFSSSFIRGNHLRLLNSPKIFNDKTLLGALTDSTQPYDHLPIYSTFERL